MILLAIAVEAIETRVPARGSSATNRKGQDWRDIIDFARLKCEELTEQQKGRLRGEVRVVDVEPARNGVNVPRSNCSCQKTP